MQVVARPAVHAPGVPRPLSHVLRTQGFLPEQTEKIEPQTLKAWVKERIEKGQPVDSELFGVFIGQKAVIKSV